MTRRILVQRNGYRHELRTDLPEDTEDNCGANSRRKTRAVCEALAIRTKTYTSYPSEDLPRCEDGARLAQRPIGSDRTASR
ncbi:hypothetical protein BCY88_08795 [Paraburkholderia fungorum]|uniref:Uncharacterized protein n=1 Tax=Paraburkholderia fungorum TaxID=134537 RepID=A0A420FS17_9BURK|nr:hypothetical protein BCY88_08795 [Paraburkholderia fungorum]